jgi:hypothetical protein
MSTTEAYPCYDTRGTSPYGHVSGYIEERADRELTPGTYVAIFEEGQLVAALDYSEYEEATTCPCCQRYRSLPQRYTVQPLTITEET